MQQVMETARIFKLTWIAGVAPGGAEDGDAEDRDGDVEDGDVNDIE